MNFSSMALGRLYIPYIHTIHVFDEWERLAGVSTFSTGFGREWRKGKDQDSVVLLAFSPFLLKTCVCNVRNKISASPLPLLVTRTYIGVIERGRY